jgi:hypothetical protein
MIDQEPSPLETASIQHVAFRDGIIVVAVSSELAARDEILEPWADTDEGKELAKIEIDFGLSNIRREVGLALLKANTAHDDFRYPKVSDDLASAVYPNPNTLRIRRLTVAEVRGYLRRAAWLSRESVIYAIAMQEQDPTYKDEVLESLLAEIDSMPEYEGAHDSDGHVHRGRLIKILRGLVPFSETASPITADDKFKTKHGRVISRMVECKSSGDGSYPPGYKTKVDQGQTPKPAERESIPLPKAPAITDLATEEAPVYSMMLIDPALHEYAFPNAEVLFRHSVISLRSDRTKLPLGQYERRLASFEYTIETVADALRQYDESADSSLMQLKLEQFLDWARQQPLYAHYTRHQLADILERQKAARDVLDDYRRFLKYGSQAYETVTS